MEIISLQIKRYKICRQSLLVQHTFLIIKRDAKVKFSGES